MAVILVKKYGNRRLYDTTDSAYITLEELAEKVRKGADVRVVDAKTNEDLTQATLAQIILESRGASQLLPVPFLVQLIRMGDDAVAEFFSRYATAALELYVQAKQGVQMMPFNPFGAVPYPTNPFARFFGGMPAWGEQQPPQGPGPQPPPPHAQQAAAAPAAPTQAASDVADLRRELDELKAALKRRK